MAATRSEVRAGAYHDSIVLMQVQAELSCLPGVEEAAVVMASEGNLALLEERELLPGNSDSLHPDDLLVVIKAATERAASEALARFDSLLERRQSVDDEGEEARPRSLTSALELAPEARWVAVSVPGEYAAGVAREALRNGCSVFLYSDNVAMAEEVELKERAAGSGVLMLGPDCGTALIGGVGFGFANRVRRGGVGIVAASGTGLQSVSATVHALGDGISHAIGTGGRDLSRDGAGRTTLQALRLLAADETTRVIVLVSKPPAPEVARTVLLAARVLGKPVVVHFLGLSPPARRIGGLHFASDLMDAAELAVSLRGEDAGVATLESPSPKGARSLLRGLMSGGTLALEAAVALRPFVDGLASNLTVPGVTPVEDVSGSSAHVILDLGADELTRGRPHPMIDQSLLLERLDESFEDPTVKIVLLDVVLGEGAHPDPATALMPRIAAAPHGVEVVVVVVGTDDDPQNLSSQVERLEEAGATVFVDSRQAWSRVAERVLGGPPLVAGPKDSPAPVLERPAAVINVGLELFHHSLLAQGVHSVQVEWRPPARGNARLISILERMKG